MSEGLSSALHSYVLLRIWMIKKNEFQHECRHHKIILQWQIGWETALFSNLNHFYEYYSNKNLAMMCLFCQAMVTHMARILDKILICILLKS